MTATTYETVNRSKLVDRLLWMTCVRLVVLTSVLLPTYLLSLTDSWQSVPFDVVLDVTGFGYLSSLVYLVLLASTQRALVAQAYLQCVGDLLLISGLVLSSGGITSPFSMLYLIVISVAAVILRRRAGLTVAEIAWLLYAGLIVLQHLGLLGEGAAAVSIGRIVYSLAIHLVGFLGVAFLTSFLARDVDRVERELAETSEDLAELELFHRDVIESMTSGLITTNPDGEVVSINQAGRSILGGAVANGTPIWELGLMSQERWRLLQLAAQRRERAREEIDLHVDENPRRVGFSVARIEGAESQLRGYLVIFQDLTSWRSLQEELELKGRMAAVGELAAGLAHEVGNPLAAISGSVQMLSSSSSLQGSQHKLLEIVLHESQRLDRTIKSFLQFARPGERRAAHFDVAAVLGENMELLRHSAEVDAHHQIGGSLEPAELFGDRDQLSQIFWNLARNALRAMPLGGILDVDGEVDRRLNSYRLTFRDSGKGMSEEEQLQLFHPFKSFGGQGVGIGMSIVYRIVEDHAGRIKVDSQPGEGTCITILLPLPAANQRVLSYPKASPSPELDPGEPSLLDDPRAELLS